MSKIIEININGSTGNLFGLLELPDYRAGEKFPMVILSHGFYGTLDYHLWPPMSKQLTIMSGIGVVRFDFAGHGRSAGKFEDMAIPEQIDDLLSIIARVREWPETLNISLVGHSQGGVVCGMVAGKCGDEQIKSLVLHSPAASIRDDVLMGSLLGAKFDPWHLDKQFYPLPSGKMLGCEYISSAMDLPIYEETAKYCGKTLIVHGMGDTLVPYTYAQRYHQILPQSEIVLIPGENHAMRENPQYAVEIMVGWLRAILCG